MLKKIFESTLIMGISSILVMGPLVEYSTQIPWLELEIRIYPGDDANFTLFEDDGFERDSVMKDHYSLIEFVWSDEQRVLSIGNRTGGSFDGMLNERIFNVVVVGVDHGVGVNVTQNVDKSVVYVGDAMKIQF